MSHHFVTVCVVCVLCATHTPCSAHTDFSRAGRTAENSVSSEKFPGPDEQLQPSLLLMKYKETHQKDIRKLSLNNLGTRSNGLAKFSNALDNNSKYEAPMLLVPVVTNETYTKAERSENRNNNGNVQNVHFPIEGSRTLKDIELLERLGQIEVISDRELNAAEFVKNPNPLQRVRTKRDVDIINEKYFMKKIFEAYGDGTSVTMEGFEKLLKKLGLSSLLTDISGLENHNIVTSQQENRVGKHHGFIPFVTLILIQCGRLCKQILK